MDKLAVGVSLLLLQMGAASVAWAFLQWGRGEETRGVFWVLVGLLIVGLAHRLAAFEERG